MSKLRTLITVPLLSGVLFLAVFVQSAAALGYEDSGLSGSVSYLGSQMQGENGFLDRLGLSHQEINSGVAYDTSITDSVHVGYGSVPGSLTYGNDDSLLYDDSMSFDSSFNGVSLDSTDSSYSSGSLGSFDDALLSYDSSMSLDAAVQDTEMMCGQMSTAANYSVTSGGGEYGGFDDFEDPELDMVDAGYDDMDMGMDEPLPMAPVSNASGGGC